MIRIRALRPFPVAVLVLGGLALLASCGGAGAGTGGNGVAGTDSSFFETFDTSCPAGWTLSTPWECGAPTSGPSAAFSGSNVIATNLAGDYANNLAWSSSTATSPTISLAGMLTPSLRFKVWYNTEGGSFDGWNVKISTDNGSTFALVTTVTPSYGLTIAAQQSWGGDQSAGGWQTYTADLSAYAGQDIVLQFGFRTDGSVTGPGVYIDDVGISD